MNKWRFDATNNYLKFVEEFKLLLWCNRVALFFLFFFFSLTAAGNHMLSLYEEEQLGHSAEQCFVCSTEDMKSRGKISSITHTIIHKCSMNININS